MRPPAAAATAPRTWLLALLLVAGLDAAITRTDVLWAPMPGEHTLNLQLVQLGQTFQAARALFTAPAPVAERVVLLGDSQMWFPGQAAYVERALRQVAPERPIEVLNLAVFGARVGDLEVLARHVRRLRPDLVVVGLGGPQLLAFDSGAYGQWPARLLDTGWRDGPLPPAGWLERGERWLRTVWPLYRFRLFARAAIEERLAPSPAEPPFPDQFASTRALHEFLYGERAAAVEAAYQRWRAAPTLAGYVDYQRAKLAGVLLPIGRQVPAGAALPADAPGLRLLDALLADLAADGLRTVVLLMPENPLLAADAAGEYHVPGFSERMAAAVAAAAERHGATLVDGRGWLPAEAFLDFVHVMPDVGGFQTPLARQILAGLDD